MRRVSLILIGLGLAAVLSACTAAKLGMHNAMVGHSVQIINPEDPGSFGYTRLNDLMKVYPAIKANVMAVGYPEYSLESSSAKSGRYIVLYNAKTRKAYGFRLTFAQGALAVPPLEYDPQSSDCKELAGRIFP